MTCNCTTYQEQRDYNPYGRKVTVHESCRKCQPETDQERFARMAREAEDYIWEYRNSNPS